MPPSNRTRDAAIRILRKGETFIGKVGAIAATVSPAEGGQWSRALLLVKALRMELEEPGSVLREAKKW